MTVTSLRTHNFHFKRFYGNENSCVLKMGCCCSCPSGDDEREPLLQSNRKTRTESGPAVNEIQSARTSHPANDAVKKTDRFEARRVGVGDLDERFSDVAETYNKQHEDYETMKNKLQTVANRYKCPTNDSLSQCLKKIKEEHANCHIILEVKGYDFTLMVRSEAEIPNDLKRTQENITELSKAAKAVISVATKLQEMIDWLLKAEDTMTKQVEAAESRHQEQKRLVDNLKENLREVRRAKEKSPKYRKEAGNLLNEAAVLSGIKP
ncbi:myosin heavy chain, clone 203 isoform X3 [Chanodichthys erythropterus]|uniref:myosin heavy chain, clone 203 isoform X3 n=1 Tax=Chanodichthys erythropterus TaxID=933992 RepID=UPI00351F54B1